VIDYSAKIKLIVDGLQSLKQVEERLTNLNRLAALDLGKAVKGTRTFGAVKKEVDDLAGSFSQFRQDSKRYCSRHRSWCAYHVNKRAFSSRNRVKVWGYK
jgi:hypothetical protein